MYHRCPILIVLALMALRALSAETLTSPQNSTSTPQAEEMTVVIGGLPISGTRVLPATEKSFRMKLSDTGQTVELFWKDLESNERRRVKKYFGLDEHDGRTVWGEKVRGARVHLASGKELVALPMPERNAYGHRAFKTCGAPLLLISEKDVQTEEPLDAYECDFYTPQEVYQRWLTQKPPAANDAAAYLALAKRCAEIELYHEALDNLKCAEIIDPRTRETQSEFRMMVLNEDARRSAMRVFQELEHAKLTENWLEASDILAKLDRNFPNSEYKSRWDAMRAKIEAGARQELKRNLIPLSYQIFLNLCDKEVMRSYKLDAKGNLVPAIPGKQITTTHGDIFRGTQTKAEFSGYVGLKCGDMELSISQKDILAMVDIQLETGDTSDVRRPTYDQILDYATNTKKRTGLKAELISALATKMNISDEKALEIFDSRITGARGHYEDGKLNVEANYGSIQEANYGKGSWLRPGAKSKPLFIDGARPQEPSKPDKDWLAETSDDPNVWWEHQSAETQIGILRAIAAEHIFRVKSVVEVPCEHCDSKGTYGVEQDDTHTTYRCPHCRGLGVVFKIRYE